MWELHITGFLGYFQSKHICRFGVYYKYCQALWRMKDASMAKKEINILKRIVPVLDLLR